MIVLLSLTFPCVVRTLTGSCSKTKRFELVGTGFALLNHEIKRVTVVSSLDCAMECTATRECRSFSFNSNESVQGNCQLNDATQSICSPSECKKSDGLVHYEASQLGCLSSPCMNLARCLESCSGESTFKCECAHKKTYGDRCEFWTGLVSC
nr:uncharacterized protein LOC131789850 [Pocillopora verrucosa]